MKPITVLANRNKTIKTEYPLPEGLRHAHIVFIVWKYEYA